VERIEHVLTDADRLAEPLVDALFAAFVASLPADLADQARGLAVTLGLAPSRAVPWSQVFSHEITLGAPGLVAEAMPRLTAAVTMGETPKPPAQPAVEDASLAHLLAILEAFATDRIEDGQTPETPGLSALLGRVREARDAALCRVAGGAATYAVAQQETLAAIAAEQRIFRGGERIDFAGYLSVSHGKQRVGLPASLALARAAAWDERRARVLARLLDAVWLGLQLHDDVVDWEDDLARGGAWATSLAGAGAGQDRAAVRQQVHASGVLARMLSASARCFRAARRRAGVLGARRLAEWARQRETITSDLARREAESPGYTHRAHALSAWAKTVLA
jgi:hypothetical protein